MQIVITVKKVTGKMCVISFMVKVGYKQFEPVTPWEGGRKLFKL